jgi:hypothetical protein
MGIQISRVGKLVIGEDGFVTATLHSLEAQDSVDPQGRERTQLEWIFKVSTTKGTSDKYLWTGLNINAEKTYYPIDANGVVSTEGQYNKLTQLLLSLGLLTDLQLHSNEDVDIDIETLKGKTFKFKVIPNKNKPSLSDVDVSTIKLIENAESNTKKLTVGTSKA